MHDILCQIVVSPPANLQDVSMSDNLGITIRYIIGFFGNFSGLKLNLMCYNIIVCFTLSKLSGSLLIPKALFHPIAVVDDPFNHIIDCISPLTKTKSGKQYIVTT